MVARLKLKRIDGRTQPGVEFAAQFDPTRENSPGPDNVGRIDRLKSFHDFLYGGAWPFLVRGLICLVNSVNVRDLNIFVRQSLVGNYLMFLETDFWSSASCFLIGTM